MKKLQKNKILLTITLLLIISKSAFSQSPLQSEGGVDTHLYKCDTAILESTAMEDGTGNLSSKRFSAGLSMLHSPYLSIFYVPLKYGLNNNFTISFSLPYLTKTLVYEETHYIKSGYGDTMFGLAGAFQPLSFFSIITTARITLPTGNVNAQDFDYYIPMGYGGYSSSLQQTLSIGRFDTGLITIRLFFSGIGIYYFESEQKADDIEKNTFDKTTSWSAMGGLELGLTENLDIQCKGSYTVVNERKYENNSAPGESLDADDYIKQISIIPFLKYRFLDDISGQAGIIYPLKTAQDDDIEKTYDPKWKAIFAIEKRFGNSTQEIRKDIQLSDDEETESVTRVDYNNVETKKKQQRPKNKKRRRR